MKPEEKSQELINKYISAACLFANAKKCAFIAIDEILSQFDGLHKPEYCAFDCIGGRKFTFESEYPEYMTGYDMIEYWQEVKNQIEKL